MITIIEFSNITIMASKEMPFRKNFLLGNIEKNKEAKWKYIDQGRVDTEIRFRHFCSRYYYE